MDDFLMAYKEVFEKFKQFVERLNASLSELFGTTQKNEVIIYSPKEYGISLIKEPSYRVDKRSFYKTGRKTQKHIPYQRRVYTARGGK